MALACRENHTLVDIVTAKGTITIKLYEEEAPKTCDNFLKLAKQGFYDGLTFHRVVKDFVIQGGDPTGTGRGGHGYTLPAEISPNLKHVKGAVAMARLPDTVNPQRRSSGSQFYICLKDNFFLDGKYTIFGQVVQGMEICEKISPGDKIIKIRKR